MYSSADIERICLRSYKTRAKRLGGKYRSRVLPDPDNVWTEWKRVIKTGGFTGLRLHDAFIAAVMLGHCISDILTLNQKDFHEVQGIKPFSPQLWEEIM